MSFIHGQVIFQWPHFPSLAVSSEVNLMVALAICVITCAHLCWYGKSGLVTHNLHVALLRYVLCMSHEIYCGKLPYFP